MKLLLRSFQCVSTHVPCCTAYVFAFLVLCVALADDSRAQQADSVQPSCTVDVPPVAEIILPQTQVTPGGVLPITLVGAADIKDVSVTFTEQKPDFALGNR